MLDSTAFSTCQKLRNEGYLVVIWTPEEIKGLEVYQRRGVQDRITELGNEVIQQMGGGE